MKELPFFEVKDGGGHVYGPFSPGWGTALLNLGGTEQPVLARLVGNDVWRPYAKIGNAPPPAGFQKPDDKTMRGEAYRLLHFLAAERVGREHGVPAPAPVAWDADFAAAVGLARQSGQVFTDARLGLRIGYGSTSETHASVYVYPIAIDEPAGPALLDEWRRQVEMFLSDVGMLASLGRYRETRRINWPDAGKTNADDPSGRFSIVGFNRKETRTINRYTGDFDFSEWFALTPVGRQWLKVRFTHEACHWAFERPRIVRLLDLAWKTVNAAQGAEQGGLGNPERPEGIGAFLNELPAEVVVEVYGFTELPDTEPLSKEVHRVAEEVCSTRGFALRYFSPDRDVQKCREIAMRGFPTVRVLRGGREIARSTVANWTVSDLCEWIDMAVQADSG